MRPRAGRPASIHKNFPPFPAHVRISSFSFLFLNKREKRSGWSCSCARAPAAAALWLLDRLMWTCHTGRAAVPYTKAAPRRRGRRHKNRNTQPIRERKVGNLLLQPPLYRRSALFYQIRNGKERHHPAKGPPFLHLISFWMHNCLLLLLLLSNKKKHWKDRTVLGTTLRRIHHLTKSKESTLFFFLSFFLSFFLLVLYSCSCL